MKKYLLIAVAAAVLSVVVFIGAQHMTWTSGTPVPLPAAWFEAGDESYSELMRNGNHWEWEITMALAEIAIFDILLFGLVWPLIRRHIHRDIEDSESIDDARHKALEERVSKLEVYNDAKESEVSELYGYDQYATDSNAGSGVRQ